jgi:hypothetical protein
MTIRKGEDWGTAETFPPDGVTVHSDSEARALVTEAKRAKRPPPALGLLGGDLCRTVGGRGDDARLHSPEARRLPVDCGAVLIDGRLHYFVAHLVARTSRWGISWWSGRIVAAMNAQFHGQWNVAPRAHPNDGRLDVFDVSLGLGDRVKARRRLRHGTHVPHPEIRERRVDASQFEFTRPMTIWLDGDLVGTARHLSLRVEPDALTCFV